jgi:hypothetical protein
MPYPRRSARASMARPLLLALGLALPGVALLSAPDTAAAQTVEVPFQVALFEPVQLRPADQEILVFRLNLIYGRNVSVKGLDVGLVNHSTGGESKGLQYGLVGFIEGDMLGWQAHLVNITRGSFTGYQSGLYNEVGAGEGFQWGFVNQATNLSGLQIALVNVADDLYGVQLGLVNVIRSKPRYAFLPLVNWKF